MIEIQTFPQPEARPKYLIPIVGTYPGMDPGLLDAFTPQGTQALLLKSNAHASLASNLAPKIREITNRGIPVIVMADNDEINYGTTHLVNQPQVEASESGVFYLETLGRETPNSFSEITQGNLLKVVDTVKEGIDQGLAGFDLGSFVSRIFSYPEGEKPTIPDPIDRLRAQHEKLLGMGLGGLTAVQLGDLERAERLE